MASPENTTSRGVKAETKQWWGLNIATTYERSITKQSVIFVLSSGKSLSNAKVTRGYHLDR